MSDVDSVTAVEALRLLQKSGPAFIDVRSEGEARDGSIPGFVNLPVLRDAERHEVGIAYKERGQESAIELGHRLVDPVRPERVSAWREAIDRAPERRGLIACWRGGLRSRISAQWLREAGASVATIEGGYKALRRELLIPLENPPELLVLAGLTGSGKTALLKTLDAPHVDLEGLAEHRGSSFGLAIGTVQPRQATFENRLGLALWRRQGTWIVEDESRLIGQCVLPNPIKDRMQRAPVVWIETPLEIRGESIFREYVLEPRSRGVTPEVLSGSLLGSLERLRKKLGHELADRLCRALLAALSDPDTQDYSLHAEWIEGLLVHYYDRMYRHAFERLERPVEFRGSAEECRAYLKSRKDRELAP